MPGAEYSEPSIAAYYGSADLSVLTGAAGLGVNHALCYGVPIIAYDRTNQGPHHHPEIAYVVDGITGVRVHRYTDEAMLQVLRDFLSLHPNPRAAFAHSISRYVADHLSLDSMVREFARVDEFIRSRSCSPRQHADGAPARPANAPVPPIDSDVVGPAEEPRGPDPAMPVPITTVSSRPE